jgi:hypothetical protein
MEVSGKFNCPVYLDNVAMRKILDYTKNWTSIKQSVAWSLELSRLTIKTATKKLENPDGFLWIAGCKIRYQGRRL